MKKKSTSQSAFFNLRVLIAAVFCLVGVLVALIGFGAFSSAFAQAKDTRHGGGSIKQDTPGTQTPEVIQLVGPVVLNKDLRELPYVPNEGEVELQPLTRHPHGRGQAGSSGFPHVQALIDHALRPTPIIPGPLLTFDGINLSQSGCGCYPPDTNGDVGPNHYVQSVNVRFAVYDKMGNTLLAPTTFNSFFAPLVGTPCAT